MHDKINSVVGAGIGFFPDHAPDALIRNLNMFWDVMPFLLAFTGINATFHAQNRPKGKKLVVLWMLSALATTPIIYLFSNQFVFVYRFVPFAAFMSIFFGIVVIETANFVIEARLKVAQARSKKQ